MVRKIQHLSIAQVLDGVVQPDDIEGLQGLVEQHKNWGAFSCRLPSYIVVNLIDALRVLREHGAGYYATSEEYPTDPDLAEPTDADLAALEKSDPEGEE